MLSIASNRALKSKLHSKLTSCPCSIKSCWVGMIYILITSSSWLPFCMKYWAGNGGEHTVSYERPRVAKPRFSGSALEHSVPEWEGPDPQHNKGPELLVGLVSHGWDCGAVVKLFPLLFSPARSLQLWWCPAAGAAGLHGLPAWLQMPCWWWEGQDADSEEVWRCPETSTEVLGFYTGAEKLREPRRVELERKWLGGYLMEIRKVFRGLL